MIQYLDDIIDSVRNENIVNDLEAIKCGNKSITYSELNDAVNHVALMLVDKGIKVEDRILVLMKKTIEALIVELAILKIGATFVPVDEMLPIKRIGEIIEKAHPVLAISDRIVDIGVECVQSDFLIANGNSMERIGEVALVRNRRSVDNVAYIIFTSGSTGTPKGVMISHRSIVSFIKTASQELQYNSNMRTLSLAPIYFDTSIHEIYCTLYAGGFVYLKDKFLFVRELYDVIVKNQISDLIIVSTIFKLIIQKLNDNNAEMLSSLKRVIFCGEACSVGPLLQFRNYCRNAKIIQGYGPTETTVGCMFKTIEKFESTKYGLLPLGQLIDNVYGILLDENNNEVDKGGVGVLYLAGIQVMKGYCGDEKLTSDVFYVDKNHGNTVWYRTNDLMYINEENEYCFVGRSDEMVKVNGKVVFLNEIVSRLRSYEEIDEVYINTIQDEYDLTRVVAFVILRGDMKLDEHQIKGKLGKELPDYMIPSIIKIIDKNDVCRTSNDKIDKKKLLELL